VRDKIFFAFYKYEYSITHAFIRGFYESDSYLFGQMKHILPKLYLLIILLD